MEYDWIGVAYECRHDSERVGERVNEKVGKWTNELSAEGMGYWRKYKENG